MGYSPGGRKPAITPIPSFSVTFDRNAVAAAAAATTFTRSGNIVASSAKIGSELLSSGTKKTVSNALKYFKKTATYLGPTLSIVSALLGFSVSGPSTNDLLAKVNKGFDKLRKEINIRLDEMKGYIDNEIVELEKRLMKSNLFEVSERWSRCANKIEYKTEIACQETVTDVFASKEKFFMSHRDHFKNKMPVVKQKGIKRLEVSLPVFSNYVTLRLICLQTLINTFKYDTTLAGSAAKLTKYKEEYKKVALASAKYVSWATRQILASRDCNTLKYPVLNKQMRKFRIHTHIRSQGKVQWGWGKEKTKVSEKTATIECDPLSKYKCKVRHSQAAVDVRPIADSIMRQGAQQACKRYYKNICQDMRSYWRKEVEITASIWQTLAQGKPFIYIIICFLSRTALDHVSSTFKLSQVRFGGGGGGGGG